MKMKSMAVIGMVYGIDYCLLDSLFYTPSTFSISQSLREVVRRRKFALVSRSSAVRHLLKAIGFPTSTATLSRRPWPSSIAPSRRLYRPRSVDVHEPSSIEPSSIEPSSSYDRHWCRSSGVEPRRRPSELAEHPRLLGYMPEPPLTLPLFGTARKPRPLPSASSFPDKQGSSADSSKSRKANGGMKRE